VDELQAGQVEMRATATQALPELSESELPPAVGLVLKLASETASARGPAAQAVRRRLCAARGGLGGGTLEALRLAARQSDAVASALLADIDGDCRVTGRKQQQATDSQVSPSRERLCHEHARKPLVRCSNVGTLATQGACRINSGLSDGPPSTCLSSVVVHAAHNICSVTPA
jgi:hypothetical protein